MTSLQNVFQLDKTGNQSTTLTDDDSCTEEELNLAFNNVYNLCYEEVLKSKSTYVLHLCGNSESSVAAGLSDNTIRIYDIEDSSSKNCYGHDNSITGLRFSPQSSHLLYSSSLDGSIKLWDLREKDKTVAEFKGNWHNEDGNFAEHPISAFDVCNRDRILVGGTECVLGDSFLLFWDVRTPGVDPIGGYWESHTQDITQVKFHHVQSDLLATGSMDGLINIFDIRQSCEDDALSYSLNTDSSVDKIRWLNDGTNLLSCITNEETLQIWQSDEASPIKNFNRDDIAKALKVKSSEDCYLVDIYLDERGEEETLLLCGSTKSECLRLLCLKDGLLKPWACLQGTRQVVRCCWANQKDGMLATGGQGGIISFWRPGNEVENHERISNKDTNKIRVKKRSHVHRKPY